MSLRANQSGNIFFYILLAVVLVAALSFAIASSLRGNSGVSNERLKLIAGEVISTGTRLSEAVTRLRLRNIPPTSLSFENQFVSGYTNPACNSDTCKIFSSGGGLAWETAPPSSQVSAAEWAYTANLNVINMGTTAPDLIAVLPRISLEVCQNINSLLGITALNDPPPSLISLQADKFTGTVPAAYTHQIGGSILTGKPAGCFRMTMGTGTALSGNPTPSYYFYQVLLRR